MDKEVAYGYLTIVGITLAAASPLPVPVSVHMLIITFAIIWVGSVNSTKKPQEGEDEMEVMQSKDAYMFPIIGSVTLGSLYLVFKYLPKEYVNYVVKAYFFVFGVFVLGAKFSTILASVLPPSTVESLTKQKWSFVVPSFLASKKPEERKDKKPETVVNTPLDLIGYMLSTPVAIWYLTHNHWVASNMFGVAFSIQGIEMISLGSYFNGAVLLGGLFFYDVFWVFGTDVMVTVAKSFDAPIKLLFPQMWEGTPSLLGLGDIVIPGIFIAMMLRFDIKRGDASRPYFKNVMVSYFLGLATTVGVMYAFKAAQPALLYLVPACLGSTMLTGFLRGELKTLMAYNEEKKEEGEAEDDSKKDK